MKISIILPVYNEAENIDPLLNEIFAVLDDYPSAEVIAVDDGSTDQTLFYLKEATKRFPCLHVVVLTRNFGQTSAIAAGMDVAKGDVILPMDADGQNDPHDIPFFLAKIESGFDIVSGWRRNRHDTWLRSALSKIANKIIRLVSGQKIHDYGCTMKAYRRAVIENIGLYGDMHRFLPAYAGMQGASVVEIETHHRARMHGKSKYTLSRVWRVLLDLFMLTFFLRSVTRPMQFFGGIGLFSVIAGVLTVVAAIAWREVGGPTLIQTPLPVLAALLVIVGVQCVLMGVLAEMSMRIYFQTQSCKPYCIRYVFPST